MPTAIIRPTAHYDYTNSSYGIANMKNMYDNNTTTYAYGRKSINAIGILCAFDASAISATIKSGGKITKITFCVLSRGANINLKINAVHSATSYSAYEDCGDNSLALPLTNYANPTEFSVALPQATLYWQNHIDSFLSGGFQIRLYGVSTEAKIYEAYAIVEYELPTINVITSSSPAEGGTVSGGGTYESGSTVTATATPKTGYAFSHWLVNGGNAGSSNPISGVLTSDTTVTAIFIKVETSKVYCGTKKVSVYCGKQKVSVYCGTVKIL